MTIFFAPNPIKISVIRQTDKGVHTFSKEMEIGIPFSLTKVRERIAHFEDLKTFNKVIKLADFNMVEKDHFCPFKFNFREKVEIRKKMVIDPSCSQIWIKKVVITSYFSRSLNFGITPNGFDCV